MDLLVIVSPFGVPVALDTSKTQHPFIPPFACFIETCFLLNLESSGSGMVDYVFPNHLECCSCVKGGDSRDKLENLIRRTKDQNGVLGDFFCLSIFIH